TIQIPHSKNKTARNLSATGGVLFRLFSVRLPLRELEPASRAALAVLFPLLHAGISREKTRVPERNLKIIIVHGQGAAQAHDDRAGLAGRATARSIDPDVHFAACVGDFQRPE